MKILLVSPKSRDSALRLVGKWDEIGLGLLYLASSLKENGFEVRVELADEININKILNNYKPDVVGITSLTANYNAAVRVLKAVKKYDISIITIIGGYHATFNTDEALNEDCVDYVIRGEGEEVLPVLLNNIINKKPYKLLNGISFKKGNRVYNKKSIALVKDINKLPFPDRSLISKYKVPGVAVIGSRGCPFRCDFCSISKFYGGTWRKRNIKNLLNELEEIDGIKKKNFKVTFRDDNLTVDVNWAKDLCKGIVDRGFKFKWQCFSRVDTINKHPELLDLMKEAGCNNISLGLESGVQEVLDSYNKNTTIEQIKHVSNLIRDKSIYQTWTLIIGSGDKYDKPRYIRKSVEFAKNIPFDIVSITILTPFPGTNLYDRLKRQGRIVNHNWDDYDSLHCVYKPYGMTTEQMQQELTNAYLELYMSSDIKTILRRLYRSRNALVNSKSLLTYLNVFLKAKLLKKDVLSIIK